MPCDIFPPIHGSSTAAYFTVKYLAEKNKVSALLTHAYSQGGKIDLVSPNIQIRYCRKTLLDSLGQMTTMFNPFFFKESFDFMQNCNCDVIQCEILWSMPSGIALKKLLKRPLVFVNENVEYLKFIEMGKFRYAGIVKKIEKLSCEEADIVIAVSDIDKKNMIEAYNIPSEKIETIPHCVDTNVFKYSEIDREYIRKEQNINEDDKVLTFVGKLDYIPNIAAVKYISERIYPEVIKRYPNSTFFIIGQTNESILNYRRRNVVMPGYVSPDELPKYLSASDIVLVPLDSGSGTRLKTLEATSCSRAVVSTRKGAEGQDFVHGEEMFLTDMVDEKFIEYVLRLMGDKDLRERMGQNARKKIEEKYSWKKIAEKFENVYDKILN